MSRITEQDSHYRHLEKMSVKELLHHINQEDQKVPLIVASCLTQIESLVAAIFPRIQQGGRLFYIGAGTSGRLGILDASECPPTFGVSPDVVIGLIAGGDKAIRTAAEFAEDNEEQAWKDLEGFIIDTTDTVIGIAASGTTPYVLGGLKEAQKHQVLTGCITCNPDAPILQFTDFPVVCPVGPEFVTGSTRMKAGTAQKLILNMISTSLMIRLGHIEDNKMVDMKPTNEKLIDRGVRMIQAKTALSSSEARAALIKLGSVRKVLESTDTNP